MSAPARFATAARTQAAVQPAVQATGARPLSISIRLSPGSRAAKRALDLVLSVLLLISAFPLIAVLAVLIKLADGGPVIHRRRVVGRKGEFDAYKLRSMRVDADEMLCRDPALRARFEANFKLNDDPRVTPLGRFLRRFSLDELPQLINVLRGQMSMVGPRMVSPAELNKFGPAAELFSLMEPGLTGYWQVYGSSRADYSRRVEMELYYARQWSLLLDLKILGRTPLRVLRGGR
jgi:lipopolysaccharide/colanic/teichoic acid biosynthesis glycosyltransferase